MFAIQVVGNSTKFCGLSSGAQARIVRRCERLHWISDAYLSLRFGTESSDALADAHHPLLIYLRMGMSGDGVTHNDFPRTRRRLGIPIADGYLRTRRFFFVQRRLVFQQSCGHGCDWDRIIEDKHDFDGSHELAHRPYSNIRKSSSRSRPSAYARDHALARNDAHRSWQICGKIEPWASPPACFAKGQVGVGLHLGSACTADIRY
jgi:hypothetical protein